MYTKAKDKLSNLSSTKILSPPRSNFDFDKQESILISSKKKQNKLDILFDQKESESKSKTKQKTKTINQPKILPSSIPLKQRNSKFYLPNSPKSCCSSDEYQGLSYKSSIETPIVSMESTELSENKYDKMESSINTNISSKKKSFDDYRVKYKTEKCKFYEVNKECKFGNNCAFAHGLQDIRERSYVSNNYKTKKCKQFFEQGYCPYGIRCQFLHKKNSSNSTGSEASKNDYIASKYSYRNLFYNLINSSDGLAQLADENFMKRPRLKTFEEIIKGEGNEDNNRYKLYNDILSIKLEDSDINNLFVLNNTQNDLRSRFMSA